MHDESDFMRSVTVTPCGCWCWTGAVMGTGDNGRQPSAHYLGERLHARRVAWAYRHGEVPDRRLVATCGDRWCVAPDHSEFANDLTDQQIIEAVTTRQPWENWSAVARRLGIRRETLSRRISKMEVKQC